jgi:hypothetical protein
MIQRHTTNIMTYTWYSVTLLWLRFLSLKVCFRCLATSSPILNTSHNRLLKRALTEVQTPALTYFFPAILPRRLLYLVQRHTNKYKLSFWGSNTRALTLPPSTSSHNYKLFLSLKQCLGWRHYSRLWLSNPPGRVSRLKTPVTRTEGKIKDAV